MGAARLARLYEVAASVTASLDPSELLRLVAHGTAQVIGVDKVAVFLVDHENRTITHRFAVGIAAEDVESNSYEELEEGLSGWVWSNGAGVVSASIIDDQRNRGRARLRAERDGHCSIAVAPLEIHGKVIGTVTVLRDDTEDDLDAEEYVYVEMVASIASIALTNARLYSDLQATMDELKRTQASLLQAQKLEAVGQLAAGIAHEINTPMQFISDNLAFLRTSVADLLAVTKQAVVVGGGCRDDGSLEDLRGVLRDTDLEFLAQESPEAITQSIEGAERVAGIVKALKEFSHPGDEVPTDVDVNRAIENCLTVTRNTWKYVADLSTDLDPAVGTAPALQGPLNQVVVNLIVNAAHAIEDVVGTTGDKGTIEVRTRRTDTWVEIRVGDSGTGIPDDVGRRLFDPFFTTKEVGRGTGQGLAIAQDVIVNKHNGELEFDTQLGVGTTFTIRIPTVATPSGEIS